MASSAEKKPIIEKLEYNYLIKDDISSLNTLMSLYDDVKFSDFDKSNLQIRKYILTNLKKNFWYLADIDQILRSLNNSIGDDLNRYEFLLSIKSEFNSFQNKKMIDKLEYLAIEHYGVSFLFEENDIFTENNQTTEKIKNGIKKIIIDNKTLVADIRKSVKKYSDTYLKFKVLNIDVNTNKQLAFDMDLIYTEDITLKQAQEINDKLTNHLYNIAVNVYAEYYWKGLCKKVINRYH